MSAVEIITEMKTRLAALGDEPRARKNKRYMKSDMQHHGLTMPQLRTLEAQLRLEFDLDNANEIVDLAERAWQSSWFEERTLAIILCGTVATTLQPRHVEDIFEGWLVDIAGWSHLDELTIKVIGVIGQNHPELWPRVFGWRLDDYMWTRRASIVSLMQVVRDGSVNLKQLSDTCSDLAHEHEFFIRKAIGWILREGVRKNVDGIEGVIIALGPKLSGLSLREAIRRYPEKKQAEIRNAILLASQ